MAKEKVKKVSINALEKALKPNTVEIQMAGNEEVTIVVTPTLSLVDTLVFVSEVVDSVVDMETGTYRPEMLEYMTRYCVMTMYANLSLPKDPEKVYSLMYQTGVFNQIHNEINAEQYLDISKIIENKIKHRLEMIRTSVVKQAEEYLDMMQSFTESAEPLFANLNEGDVASLMKKMSEEERLDEAKIAKIIHDMNTEEQRVKRVESEIIEFKK